MAYALRITKQVLATITAIGRTLGLAAAAIGLWFAPAATGAAPVAAEKIALVIGNDFYQNAQPLRRAVADARAMRDHLENVLGYRVYYAENAEGSLMGDAVAGFLGATKPGDVASVFFWGYGEYASFGVSKGLYLFPVDMPALEQFEAGRDSVIAARAISVDVIRDHLRRRNIDLRLFVFDARPSTPDAWRDDGQGELSRIEAGPGEMLMYSAQRSQRPLDSLGPTDGAGLSVFTRVLVEQFQPETPLRQMASNVQVGVAGLAMAAGLSQEPRVEAGPLARDCLADACAPPRAETANVAESAAIAELRQNTVNNVTRRDAAIAQVENGDAPATFEQPLIQSIEPIVPIDQNGIEETAPSGVASLAIAPLGGEQEEPAAGAFGAPAGAPQAFAPRVEPLGDQGAPAAPPIAPLAIAPNAAPNASSSDDENENAMIAYEDATSRDSMTALQLVAQLYPETVWGRLAALDVEENRVQEQAAAALQRISDARASLEWERLRQTRDMKALDAFISEHGDGPLAAEAAAARTALEADLRAGQVELRRLRYYWSAIDGDWGPGSQRAMRAYQTDAGFDPDGRLTKTALAALVATPTPPDDVRPNAPTAAPAPTETLVTASTPQPSGEWRFRVEIQAELENGGRRRCVGSVVYPQKALRSGREPIDCGPIQSFQLNVRGDGELIEGAVFAGGAIPLRGKRWSFVGAGFTGSDVDRVKVIVQPQIF